MNFLGIGSIIESVGNVADNLFTSDEERLDNELKSKALDVQTVNKVHDTNIAEAKHRSIFVAGWRPFIGWVCGTAIALTFIPKAIVITGMWAYQNYLIISGKSLESVPQLLEFPNLGTGELITLTLSLLGLGGLRTYEKFKGLTK